MKSIGLAYAHDHNRITLTATTETTLIAAVASNRHEIQAITIANRDNVAHTIDFRETTGGTVRQSIIIAAGDTKIFNFQSGLPAAAVNTNWTAQLRESATTAVEIATSSFRTTA